MPDEATGVDEAGTSNLATKFAVGMFAASCAVFCPSLVLYLKYAGSQNLTFPDRTYVAVGIGFAAVIGAITMIFEYRTRRTLAQTFMAALGIPALLSGALNTVGLAENGLLAQQTTTNNFHKAANSVGIQIDQPVDVNAPGQPQHGTWLDSIRPAYAGDTPLPAVPLLAQAGYSPQFVTPRYLVVLGRTSSRSSAEALAQELRRHVPDATVVDSGGEFLVVAGRTPLPGTDALNRATQIKRDGFASPSLAPVQIK
jgi:hypothetical protein